MSSKSSGNRSAAPRVATGMPWWVWGGIGLFGVAIVLSLISSSVPKDPLQLLADANKAAENADLKTLLQSLEDLRQFPDREGEVRYLEAIVKLGESKPLKAIPLLKQAVDTPTVRSRAWLALGRAYGTAGQLQNATDALKQIIDDPEVGSLARFSLAGMMNSIQAYDEALVQFNALAEKDYDLGQTLYQRGEILIDRGEYEQAVADIQKSIDINPNEPTNSLKVVKLLRTMTRLGRFADTDKYAEQLDNPIAAGSFKAEKLISEGKIKEAIAALDAARRDARENPQLVCTWGKVMLAWQDPEKAKQALAEVYVACRRATRNTEGMQVLQGIAELVGNKELADLARQNVEQLQAIRQQMLEALKSIGSDVTSVEKRMDLADLAIDCGEIELAERVYRGLAMFFPDQEALIAPRRARLDAPLALLVDLGNSVDLPAPAPPPDAARPDRPPLPPPGRGAAPAEPAEPAKDL
ncbi:MAG: tetratricopeptide repeat protein, partial [Planctomycetaceae bacterium]